MFSKDKTPKDDDSDNEIKFYHKEKEHTNCENELRKRGRPLNNAARERSRVKTLRTAFLNLQETLPSVPPDTKLSKLDVLVLATTYITHLMKTLDNYNSTGNEGSSVPIFHPVKKWPMRTRLYDGILDSTKPVDIQGSSKRKKIGIYSSKNKHNSSFRIQTM